MMLINLRFAFVISSGCNSDSCIVNKNDQTGSRSQWKTRSQV